MRCKDCGKPTNINPKTGQHHKYCRHCFNKRDNFTPETCPYCGEYEGQYIDKPNVRNREVYIQEEKYKRGIRMIAPRHAKCLDCGYNWKW